MTPLRSQIAGTSLVEIVCHCPGGCAGLVPGCPCCEAEAALALAAMAAVRRSWAAAAARAAEPRSARTVPRAARAAEAPVVMSDAIPPLLELRVRGDHWKSLYPGTPASIWYQLCVLCHKRAMTLVRSWIFGIHDVETHCQSPVHSGGALDGVASVVMSDVMVEARW